MTEESTDNTGTFEITTEGGHVPVVVDLNALVNQMTNLKVALVNLTTGVVENLIMVKSLEDPIAEGYKLVEIPLIERFFSEEESQLYAIIREIDPSFVIPKQETPIHVGTTKWSEEKGFYEE